MAVKKGLKTVLIIVVIALLAIVVAYFAWNSVKYRVIKNKISSAVYDKTNGLYTIHYDDMRLDEVGGYLHISNLTVRADTAMFRTLSANGEGPGLVVCLSVPELIISGVKTPKAMLGKRIQGSAVEVNGADIQFYFSDAKQKDHEKSGLPLYRQLLGDLAEIQVDTVSVGKANLRYINIESLHRAIAATGLSIRLLQVKVDSLSGRDTSNFLFAKQTRITGDSVVLRNRPDTYHYIFTGFEFDAAGRGDLHVKKMAIVPRLSEEKFAAYSKLQKDRFDISVDGVSLHGLDLKSLMRSELAADSLTINEGKFKVYRDLSYPRDTLTRVGTYPHQLLMKLPFSLSINKLFVRDAFVEYKEKNPKSDYSGKVQFVHANAVIGNITNDAARLRRNSHCLLDFNAQFLGFAPIHAHLDMRIKDPQGKFSFSGSMESFNASDLSVITEPMGLTKIENGKVDGVKFNFLAHNYGSDGNLQILYHDLKMTLLKKDSIDHTLQKKKLASFVANLIVKNDNPSGHQSPRQAQVNYKRDPNRSFFNLMWKSIFSGVKQSVGM